MTFPKASRTEIWRDALEVFPELWAFVKQPYLVPSKARWTSRTWISVGLLALLDLAITVPILAFLEGYEVLLVQGLSQDVPVITAFDDETFLEALLLGVIVAPFFEEILFRGWLTGKWKHLAIAVPWLVWIISGSVLVATDANEEIKAAFAMSLLFLLAFTVVVLWIMKSDNSTSPRLVRRFPLFFWFSVASFGLVHLSNYEYDNYALLIPYVLPQLFAGLVWGFARIHYGIWASMLLHALSNFWITCLIFGPDQWGFG